MEENRRETEYNYYRTYYIFITGSGLFISKRTYMFTLACAVKLNQYIPVRWWYYYYNNNSSIFWGVGVWCESYFLPICKEVALTLHGIMMSPHFLWSQKQNSSWFPGEQKPVLWEDFLTMITFPRVRPRFSRHYVHVYLNRLKALSVSSVGLLTVI